MVHWQPWSVAGWTRDHSPVRGTVTGLGPRKLYQCALRSHMYSKRVQCRLPTRQRLVQPVPICAHCRDSESGESISISHSRSCGKLRQHAVDRTAFSMRSLNSNHHLVDFFPRFVGENGHAIRTESQRCSHTCCH